MSSIVLSAEGEQFEVDSALLVGASPVFATLLHLPADPDERAIRLSGDTARDVRCFLEALRSADGLSHAPLAVLLSIASVAHKYECDALAASTFRLACDAVRTASPPPDAVALRATLSLAARFGPPELDVLSDALIARAVDPLVVLVTLEESCVHAPRLEGWALYALVTNPSWRALPLAPELRRRLLLGENALRDVQPLRWASLPRDHAPCIRAWANAWPDGAVRGQVDVIHALESAQLATTKRLTLVSRRDNRPCKGCMDMAKSEVESFIYLLQFGMRVFFTEEGPFDTELKYEEICDGI